MSSPLRIGLVGLGTVGGGVVKIVQAHGALLARRAGRPIQITAVSARNRARDRGFDIAPYGWEDDPVALARRDDVDVVLEMIGGEDGPARACVEAALTAGKHVVTANKAMLAVHGAELATLAEQTGAALRFEAAVAGGIPVVKALTEGLAANSVTTIKGVMNGTCNYILTEMERTGADYAEMLNEAQKLGYAEADPTFDVGGIDAAHKLALLAAIGFGTEVDFDGVAIEGIERVSRADIDHARDLGFRIKLLGVARMTDTGLEQRMQPCLVPATGPLGQLEGVTNAVQIQGDFVGSTFFSGPGAGEGATGSAVVADVIDIARGMTGPAFGQPCANLVKAARSGEGADAPFYLRLLLTDAPGVLARVASALGEEGVSIDRMRQMAHEGPGAPVLIVTHAAPRGAIDGALGRISAMEVSLADPVAIRIEA